jgi:hypothetical protein
MYIDADINVYFRYFLSMCKCVEAGAKPLTPKPVTVGKRVFEARSTDLCDRCGDFELAVALDLAKNGPMNGESFRSMHELLRDRLGLTGKILADLLGRTPEAISRWKDGSQTLDPLAWTILGAAVVEYSHGRFDTLLRLGVAQGKTPAPSGKSMIQIATRPTSDFRAQHDAKRREIVKAIAPAYARAIRNRSVAQPNDLEEQRIDLKDRLVAIDARFANVAKDVLRALEEDTVRANGLPDTSARLAWLAKIEDPERELGAQWPKVKARIVPHYRRAEKESPEAVHAMQIARLRDAFRRARPS